MKLIGFDYGRRRIGISVTDETGTFVRSLPIIDRSLQQDAVAAVLAVIIREDPDKIVFGLPLSPEDSETIMSSEIRRFAQSLALRTDIPIDFIDESLTSKRASDIIRMRKKKHRQAKENIDKVAACLILEAYLQQEKPCGNFM